MAGWNPLDEPIDYAILGGRRTPGLATITKANNPRHWDQRQGYGFSGATVVFKGIWLSAFTLTIRLVTSRDWEGWDAFKVVLARPPAVAAPGALYPPRPRALDIWHPHLEALGISAVVVTDVKQPEPADGTGLWSVEIPLLEYRRPRLALSRPDGAQSQPTDPVSQQIAANTAVIDGLASQ